MGKEQILFNHFLDGIYDAAWDLYDLNPLRCKKFKSNEVISLFRKFVSIVVARDPFWKNSSVVSYIYENKHGDRVLKELELKNQQYYLINDEYKTNDNYMDFFTPPMYSVCFCAVQASSSHGCGFDSSYWFSPQGPFYLNYLSVSSQMRGYYGESYYEEVIIPHMTIFKEAVVEILSLRKFSSEHVKHNLIALLKDTLNGGKLDECCLVITEVRKHELGDVYAKEISVIENTCKSIEASVKTASELKDSIDKVFDALEDKDYSLFSDGVINLDNNLLSNQMFMIHSLYEELKEQLRNFIKKLETTGTQVVFHYISHIIFEYYL